MGQLYFLQSLVLANKQSRCQIRYICVRMIKKVQKNWRFEKWSHQVEELHSVRCSVSVTVNVAEIVSASVSVTMSKRLSIVIVASPSTRQPTCRLYVLKSCLIFLSFQFRFLYFSRSSPFFFKSVRRPD